MFMIYKEKKKNKFRLPHPEARRGKVTVFLSIISPTAQGSCHRSPCVPAVFSGWGQLHGSVACTLFLQPFCCLLVSLLGKWFFNIFRIRGEVIALFIYIFSPITRVINTCSKARSVWLSRAKSWQPSLQCAWAGSSGHGAAEVWQPGCLSRRLAPDIRVVPPPPHLSSCAQGHTRCTLCPFVPGVHLNPFWKLSIFLAFVTSVLPAGFPFLQEVNMFTAAQGC